MDTMNMFTKDEQTLLRNTSAKYKWIARDMDGGLFVYKKKPKSTRLFMATSVMGQVVSALSHSKAFLRK